MNKDLTVGKPESVLWRFCLPLFGSVIFQQLYNIADSLVAGKFINESALAAVGNSYEITLIFIAFAFGCNMGCSVIVSRLFGAKEYRNMKTAVSTTFIFTAVLLAVMMIAGLLTSRELLALIHTPGDIMDASLLYLNIYIYGLPFMFFYNIATGIFSALGDSRTPFLCQGVSAILAVAVVIRRLTCIKTDGRFRFFDGSILKQILVVAIPSTLQQSFISIGNIIIQSVINDFGTSVIAGYSAAVKLNNLVITSLTTLGNGISNYTAQNIGAGKIDRIHSGFKASLKLVWLLCIPFALLYFTCGRWLLLLFLDNPTATAIKTGIVFLCILAPFYFIVSIKLMADGILRGAGIMNKFMISTFTDLILRVILSIIFSKMFGSVGIWCSWPVGWCCGTAVSVLFYRGEQKRDFKNAFEA